jgi:hypothetical protein
MRRPISLALAGLLSATALSAQALNTLTPAEKAAGWKLLFDGKTTSGWRGYMKPDLPAGWKVVDGALTRVAQGGDILTTDKYKNFELVLDASIPRARSRATVASSSTPSKDLRRSTTVRPRCRSSTIQSTPMANRS